MYYKLTFYVPSDYLACVKEAIFEAGAGTYDGYEKCCWQVLGEGQFRPTASANPFIGEVDGTVETVAEYRVEVLCEAERIDDIRAALIATHPYEVPAYDFIKCER